jgi:alkanesulfonate monooxygenase SsuD/methylene tetrahydromethanopterin reductase-like flavin-dependent oxidoreductase (luciferase family)
MVEIGIFDPGGTTLEMKEGADGHKYPDASIEELTKDKEQVFKDQIELGVAADKAGFDRLFNVEHHFQPLGVDANSGNPLMIQAAISQRTEDIKLCQAANIITWHEPLRFAEQAALLDVISDGRAEIGVGRGYQPRENETLGQYWGGTIQDQEKNRVSFEEKLEIIEKAWTEDFMSYNGDHHEIPPKHTKWHHDNERAYFEDSVSDPYGVDDTMDWKDEGDYYSDLWNQVVSGGTTLNSIGVYPKPVQEPHPQIWMPVTSPRSIEFAAQQGYNPYFVLEPIQNLAGAIDLFYQAVEEAGWPDHRDEYDGEPFARGWDSERQRGVATGRLIFNTEVHGDDVLERISDGIEAGWNWYGPFGFTAVLATGDEEPPAPSDVSIEMLEEKGIAYFGDTDHIIDKCAELVEVADLEDMNFQCWFNHYGMKGEQAIEQVEHFGENVMPYLQEEFPKVTATADD